MNTTQIPAPDLNEWTDRNGQTRRYVNNWTSLVGLETERYKTGNLSHAWFDGQRISNASARALLLTKVWLDSDDGIHVDRHPGWAADKNDITVGLITDRVRKAIDHHA